MTTKTIAVLALSLCAAAAFAADKTPGATFDSGTISGFTGADDVANSDLRRVNLGCVAPVVYGHAHPSSICVALTVPVIRGPDARRGV